ncbi:protease HtpX [Desertibacillus haloalkaliphilus]|uniref:protease HtpX n=1 Tax=Desertibacillus haloalkaliphilus TaxID=1328930 RepID=UPI001C261052|nr:protease HtpX [Desertibacillus haloalkaliphilus]MBU8905268.1 protease HtpX [Desertibacillus haloalkaliphilus]
MGKRILLFIGVNLLILTTIMIVMSIFGVSTGTNIATGEIYLGELLVFSAIVGFSGAFISLALSRIIAKKMMNVRVLNPDKDNLNYEESELIEMVHRLSRNAGLMHMPEVGIYESNEVNAFATGPSKKRSLVAVSRGLLNQMDKDAVEGVVAHEVAHVANGDMVTMTLVQGVINTFVVFFARIAAFIAARFAREEIAHIVHFVAIIFFQIVFSILGSILVMAYSRYREYHADRGGADLAGKDKMVHALRSLQQTTHMIKEDDTAFQSMKISNKSKAALLFSSHPPLEDRIERLQQS